MREYDCQVKTISTPRHRSVSLCVLSRLQCPHHLEFALVVAFEVVTVATVTSSIEEVPGRLADHDTTDSKTHTCSLTKLQSNLACLQVPGAAQQAQRPPSKG